MKNKISLLVLILMLGLLACKKQGPEITVTTPEKDAVFFSGNNNLHIQATITDKEGIQAYSMSIANLAANTTTSILDITGVSKSSVTIDQKISLIVKGQTNYKLNISATNLKGTTSTSELTILVKE